VAEAEEEEEETPEGEVEARTTSKLPNKVK